MSCQGDWLCSTLTSQFSKYVVLHIPCFHKSDCNKDTHSTEYMANERELTVNPFDIMQLRPPADNSISLRGVTPGGGLFVYRPRDTTLIHYNRAGTAEARARLHSLCQNRGLRGFLSLRLSFTHMLIHKHWEYFKSNEPQTLLYCLCGLQVQPRRQKTFNFKYVQA